MFPLPSSRVPYSTKRFFWRGRQVSGVTCPFNFLTTLVAVTKWTIFDISTCGKVSLCNISSLGIKSNIFFLFSLLIWRKKTCSEDKNAVDYFIQPYQAYYTCAVFIIRNRVKQKINLKSNIWRTTASFTIYCAYFRILSTYCFFLDLYFARFIWHAYRIVFSSFRSQAPSKTK